MTPIIAGLKDRIYFHVFIFIFTIMKLQPEMIDSYPDDAKKVFRQMGTCSRTYFYLLNRHFGHLKESEERAADTLAGGIMREGYQCGMLWGASLAIGAEAYRRSAHVSQAIALSIEATKLVMTSFIQREHTDQCRDITHCDFSNKLSMAKYMLSGKFLHCFQLAESWAPEAISTAMKALADKPYSFERSLSCATEVARKMGANEEQMVMVAGFAGGLGLSGGGCGALSGALWMNALHWCNEHAQGSSFYDPKAQEMVNRFFEFTHDRILCEEISQTRFGSVEEHTQYLKKGGCRPLLDMLSQK